MASILKVEDRVWRQQVYLKCGHKRTVQHHIAGVSGLDS